MHKIYRFGRIARHKRAVAIGLDFAFVKLFLPLLYETEYNRRNLKKIGKD